MSRNITNTPTKIFVNTVSAREPLELLTPSNTSSTMTLKGLNGFTANKFVKVNSTGDGLEYADDNDTQYTAASPLKLTANQFSIDQNLFNLTTTINDNDEILLFDSADNFDKITFSNLKSAITTTENNFGTSSTGDISIGNNTYATTIYGVNTILNSEQRSIITFSPPQNQLLIGNSTDDTRIFIPIFYGNSGTAKRLSILDTTLNNEIIFNTQSLSADITLTMPNSTGTLALFSQIPTNNNQLTNGSGYITTSSIPSATAPIVLTGGSYTLPANSFTTITAVPNTNLILMVDSSNSYKKVTVQNLLDLYQDSINYNAELPLIKDTTNDKYEFTIRGLTAAVQAQVEDQMIMIMGNAGIDTFRKMTGLQLQQYITNEGVSFGTNIADLGDRTFGNGSRDSVYNGKTLYIKSLDVDRLRLLDDVLTFDRAGADFRVGHNEDTNNFSNVSTTCRISSINDLHLFSPGQFFAGSLNRFVCIAGNSQSQSETAIFGYAGSSISIANGGIPNGHTPNPIGSAFVMSTGAGVFTIANRPTTSFSSTITQFQINQQDTNFYTDNVIINGGTSTEAILKLNSHNGAIHAGSVGQILAYNSSAGLVQLGSSFNDAEAKGNIFYVKQLRVTNFINTGLTDLKLAVNGSNRILISYSNSSYVLIGEKAASGTPNPEAALHICNVGTTSDYQASRIRIESRKSTHDPVLEFVANTGIDSATRKLTYIYANYNGDMTFTLSDLTKSIITTGNATFERPIKNTYTGTSFGSTVAGMTAFPPVGQQLFQTSTSVGQGYLVNTVYRVPSSTEKYYSCFQLQLTSGSYILGWGTHTGSSGSGTFTQIFYIRSDGAYFGAGSLVTSDRRIKKDIINADGEECINILKSIKLKKYKYNDDWARQRGIENNNYVYGFIAQDIGNSPELNYCWDNKTAPLTVDGEDIFDMNTIDKPKILSVLWAVCDKQQTYIEELQNTITTQQTYIEELQSKVSTLETEIANIKTHLNL